MRAFALAFAMLCLVVGTTASAMADDWTAEKLRGRVLQLVDGEWLPLVRGDIVPDSRVIRTMGGARVTLVRGEEVIDLAANTQIQIYDEARRKPFTTVKQYYGTVEVEAEVQDVQHFAVQTPYLVAVVKGTKFVVTSSDRASEVAVTRGAVRVNDRDDGSHTTVTAGQSASLEPNATIVVAGRGELPDVIGRNGDVIETQQHSPSTGNLMALFGTDRGSSASGDDNNGASAGGGTTSSGGSGSSGGSSSSSGDGGEYDGSSSDSGGPSGGSAGGNGNGNGNGNNGNGFGNGGGNGSNGVGGGNGHHHNDDQGEND